MRKELKRLPLLSSQVVKGPKAPNLVSTAPAVSRICENWLRRSLCAYRTNSISLRSKKDCLKLILPTLVRIVWLSAASAEELYLLCVCDLNLKFLFHWAAVGSAGSNRNRIWNSIHLYPSSGLLWHAEDSKALVTEIYGFQQGTDKDSLATLLNCESPSFSFCHPITPPSLLSHDFYLTCHRNSSEKDFIGGLVAPGKAGIISQLVVLMEASALGAGSCLSCRLRFAWLDGRSRGGDWQACRAVRGLHRPQWLPRL
jgi:hypothetical protein